MSDDAAKPRRTRVPEVEPRPVVVVSDVSLKNPGDSKYPSLNSGNSNPSAPPAQVSAATVTSPAWIDDQVKKERKVHKSRPVDGDKKVRSPTGEKSDKKVRSPTGEKSDKKVRSPTGDKSDKKVRSPTGDKPDSKSRAKAPKITPQEIKAREAAEARYVRENPRASPKDADAVRRTKAARMKGVAESSNATTRYPKRVEWESKSAKMSKTSFLVVAGLCALVGIMVYANLAIDVKVPLVGPGFTIIQADGTEPPLIQALLNMTEAPMFDCGSSDRSQSLIDSSVKASAAGVTIRAPITNFGTDCASYAFRVGYCVRDDTCSIISDQIVNLTTNPTATQSYCTYPTGPRLSTSNVFITFSFVEILNDNPIVVLVPTGVFLFVVFAWALAAANLPAQAPRILSISGTALLIVVFVVAVVGSIDTLNYWILIYAGLTGCVAYFFSSNFAKIGNVLRIGAFVMSGDSLDGVVRSDDYKKNSLAIIAPAFLAIFVQAVLSLSLLFLAAAVPYITDWSASVFVNSVYIWAQRWQEYGDSIAATLSYNLYNPSAPTPSTSPDALKLGLLDCAFTDITSLNTAVIVFVVFYPFASLYYEYAVKFLVNCAIADWYCYGTRHHKPPTSGGLTNVGISGFRRAMWTSGWKIFWSAFWGTLATSSVSTLGGWKAFLLHFVLSPIDAVVYSFVGMLFRGICKFRSRFALVHASMFSSKFPVMETCERSSFYLIRKTYGRRFAQVGDSPESRLLFICGSFASLAAGLASWVWVDYIQRFDSPSYFSGWTLAILWVVGSLIQKPGLVVAATLLVDTQYDWTSVLNVDQQMAKNGVVALIVVAGIANTLMRMAIQISTSAVDATVYCFAIEESKRRKIRSIKLNELIHVYYLGDAAKIPPGHTLEKVAIVAPSNAVAGQKLTVEVEGNNYAITLPGGVKPGHEFEVAIAIPINRVDMDEASSEYDSDENSAGVVRNIKPASPQVGTSPTILQNSGPPVRPTRPIVEENAADSSQRTVVQTN